MLAVEEHASNRFWPLLKVSFNNFTRLRLVDTQVRR